MSQVLNRGVLEARLSLTFAPSQMRTSLMAAPPQETLRRLSQALSVTDFEGLAEKSNLELGLGLEALEGGGAASLSSSVEVNDVARSRRIALHPPPRRRPPPCGIPRTTIQTSVVIQLMPQPISGGCRHTRPATIISRHDSYRL